MILKLLRVSLHPWLWFTVVRPAVVRNTENQSMERRNIAGTIVSAIEALFDPDDPRVIGPHVRLSSWDARTRDEANEKLKADFPVSFRSHPDFQPAPAPLLRKLLDFSHADVNFIKESLEKFAKAPDVPNDMAMSIVNTYNAVCTATPIEIDTEPERSTGS